MKLTAILPWFGGNRTLAPRIVEELGENAYYFEPGAGMVRAIALEVLVINGPSVTSGIAVQEIESDLPIRRKNP